MIQSQLKAIRYLLTWIETMPHAMYFNDNASTVTKINHVPYQTIQHNDKGMFPAHLMDDTPRGFC